MTEDAIQVARDCAAIVELASLQTLIGPLRDKSPRECCREITNAFQRKWPEAFLEPEPPKLRRVRENE